MQEALSENARKETNGNKHARKIKRERDLFFVRLRARFAKAIAIDLTPTCSKMVTSCTPKRKATSTLVVAPNQNYVKYRKGEIRLQRKNMFDASSRENASGRCAIGFRFAFDRMRGRRQFCTPITVPSKAEPMEIVYLMIFNSD